MVLEEKYTKPSQVAWPLSPPETDGSLSVHWVSVEVFLELRRCELATWAQFWFEAHTSLHTIAKIPIWFDCLWCYLSYGNLAELRTVIFFFKTCLSLPSVLFLLQSKPWWSGRAVKLSPLFHGGREEQRRTKRTPAAGDIVWERVLVLNEVSLVMYLLRVEYLLLHIFLICLSLQNVFIIGAFFFLVSKCLVDRWQDKFCNNLLYSYFKLCWFFFELVTFCHILIMVLFSTMLKPDNCHDRAARPPLLFPHYFSWPLPIPLFQL